MVRLARRLAPIVVLLAAGFELATRAPRWQDHQRCRWSPIGLVVEPGTPPTLLERATAAYYAMVHGTIGHRC